MLFANMFECVVVIGFCIGFCSCDLTIDTESLENEIVDCRRFHRNGDATFDPITQEKCKAFCAENFNGRIYYAVAVTPNSTHGSCFCVDEPTNGFSYCRCGACNNKCPSQPTKTCGSIDGECASFFRSIHDERLLYFINKAGSIASHGHPGDYGDYRDDSYTIIAQSKSRITLTFSAFEIEETYDYLTTYSDGDQISELTGQNITLPGPFVLYAQEVTLKLRSDESVNFKGFNLSFTIDDIPDETPPTTSTPSTAPSSASPSSTSPPSASPSSASPS